METALVAFPGAVWVFKKEGEEAGFNLDVSEHGVNSFNPETAKSVFIHSYEHRELLRLYVDGLDDRIPLQYQFLSLFKSLELIHRKFGRWDHLSLAKLVGDFAHEFAIAGFAQDPIGLLHDLRDKCAHIRTGRDTKRETLGVTHLNHSEVQRVASVLPVLRSICATALNECLGLKLQLNTDVITDRFPRIPKPDST